MIKNQRGIALIIVLVVVALLAITVVEFSYSVEVDQRMARNSLHALQASLLVRSGIAIGEAFLMRDEDPLVDSFAEEWCPGPAREGRSCQIDQTSAEIQLPENAKLRIEIFDEGAKLNINLVRPRNQQEWKLWRQQGGGSGGTGAPQSGVLPLFQSWKNALGQLLSARSVDPQGADVLADYWDKVFESIYGPPAQPGQNPTPAPTQAAPGQPGGTPTPVGQVDQYDFTALDDVPGRVPGVFPPVATRKLRSVATALPRIYQQVNANTASREVLTAIIGDPGAVDNIISQRATAPIRPEHLAQFVTTSGGAQADPTYRNAKTMLGVRSGFYLIRASAIVNVNPLSGRGGVSRTAEMLVQRTPRAAQPGAATGTVRWTLTRLSWQKEGGAALFRADMDGNGDESNDANL